MVRVASYHRSQDRANPSPRKQNLTIRKPKLSRYWKHASIYIKLYWPVFHSLLMKRHAQFFTSFCLFSCKFYFFYLAWTLLLTKITDLTFQQLAGFFLTVKLSEVIELIVNVHIEKHWKVLTHPNRAAPIRSKETSTGFYVNQLNKVLGLH